MADTTRIANNAATAEAEPHPAPRPIEPQLDNCDAPPKVTSAGSDNPGSNFQVEGGFNILCGEGDWGPGGVVQPVDANTMILRWYDNGLLRLIRQ